MSLRFDAGLAGRLPGRTPEMERTIRVATGESVAFSYELAGVGSRFIAVAIDLTIQVTVAVVVTVALAWIGLSFPRASGVAGNVGESVLTAVLIVFSFLLFFGYFIIMEWAWDGRTPGKRLMGIRVIRDGGFPLDFTASVVRNVIRMLEFSFGFYVVSAVSCLISPTNRRIGDYAAGTLVVRDDAYVRAPMPPAADDDPAVAGVTLEERELAYRYVVRRAGFGTAARARLAARLAAPLRERMGSGVQHLDDDALLRYVVQLSRPGAEERGRA